MTCNFCKRRPVNGAVQLYSIFHFQNGFTPRMSRASAQLFRITSGATKDGLVCEYLEGIFGEMARFTSRLDE